MGRKLDLGDLGDAECEHILEVINRDFRLRQLETERLQKQGMEVQEENLKTGQCVQWPQWGPSLIAEESWVD